MLPPTMLPACSSLPARIPVPACVAPDCWRRNSSRSACRQLRAIQNFQRRDAAQIGRDQLGKAALQWLERGVPPREGEGHHRDRRDWTGDARQLSLLRDRLLGARLVLPSRKHGESRVDLLFDAARFPHGQIRLVRGARSRKVVLRLRGEPEIERRDAVLRVRFHRLAECGSGIGETIGLEVRDAERADHRPGFRIGCPRLFQLRDAIRATGDSGRTGADQQRTGDDRAPKHLH